MSSAKINIRQLIFEDFPAWLPLWDGNNMGQRDEAVTARTWERLIDPNSAVKGLGAFQGENMVGILHYVLHPTTGSVKPVCYMQDLYVDPAQRRKGIARTLIKDFTKLGEKEGWTRIYWLAEQNNKAVQSFYKNLGVKLDFTLHVMPLGAKG